MKLSRPFLPPRTPRLIMLLAATCLHAAAAFAQTTFGTAETYGVLGASAVTNTGPTLINGDLGVSPGTSISGFPPGSRTGVTNVANAAALQAQNDATTGYNALAGQACGTTLTGDLGGRVLTPGVYCFASTAQLTGTLTLDAAGTPSPLFIFQIGSALTTASGSAVALVNGAQPCQVFWQVGSSATIGTGTAFVGTVVALASVTLNTAATLRGRAIARTGAVTLDSNTVTPSSCATIPPVGGPGGAGGVLPIPTLSEWAMIVLAVLMALTALIVLRRQRR